MPVIAEGVETERQARELQKLGFSHVQGYLYQKPLPFSEWHIDSKPKKENNTMFKYKKRQQGSVFCIFYVSL